MSPITANLAAGSAHVMAETLHAEAQHVVETSASAHPATTGNSAPPSTTTGPMANLVPPGGLHPIADGQTSSAKIGHLFDGLRDLINEAIVKAAAIELAKRPVKLDLK